RTAGPRRCAVFRPRPGGARRPCRALPRREQGAEMSAPSNRAQLQDIAFRAMRERGLDPEFPPDVLAQVEAIVGPPRRTEEPVRDLRGLLWCSIDNDDSRDLDQLSVAEPLA